MLATGHGSAIADGLDDFAAALSESRDALFDLGSEIVADFVVEQGLEIGCDTLGLPTVKAACVSLVGYDRITADGEALVAEFEANIDIDDLEGRLSQLGDLVDPSVRADALTELDAILLNDLEALYATSRSDRSGAYERPAVQAALGFSRRVPFRAVGARWQRSWLDRDSSSG